MAAAVAEGARAAGAEVDVKRVPDRPEEAVQKHDTCGKFECVRLNASSDSRAESPKCASQVLGGPPSRAASRQIPVALFVVA